MPTKTHTRNNLYLSNPSIAREWHSAKNGSLTPKDVTGCFNRKIWWLCPKDHVWSATINERIHGMNCPHCFGKKVEEKNIPHVFDPDLAKDWHPTKNESLEIWWQCPNGHEWSATVKERIQGKGCPFCIGKKIAVEDQAPGPAQPEEDHPAKTEDRIQKDIKAQADDKVSPENCLQSVNPRLAEEWHPSRNGSLTPADVTPHSTNNVWWKCSKGHEWKAAISSRSGGQGCFYCSYIQKRKRS